MGDASEEADMVDIPTLKTEIDTDPLARGYAAMNDAAVAADLMTIYRDAPASSQALLEYLTLERFHTGSLYGRLRMVANSMPVRDGANTWTIPPLPIGLAGADVAISQDHIASAAALLRFVDTDTALTVTLLDSRITNILDDLALAGCEAIGAADKTAIQALSQSQQSRASELGLGIVKEGHVQIARAQ